MNIKTTIVGLAVFFGIPMYTLRLSLPLDLTSQGIGRFLGHILLFWIETVIEIMKVL